MARTKTNKEETDLIEKVKEKVAPAVKKARPNYYWVRPKVTGEDAYGLSNYDLSKWRDTVEIISCAYDENAKRWLTGLDEFDPKIITMVDEEARDKKIADIIELRTQLEKQTGLNLSATNDAFWQNFLIDLGGRKKPFIPHLNPMDRIAIEVLRRRGDVPFGSHDLNNYLYVDAKFYIETEEAESNIRKNRKTLEKEAIAASFNLENDYDRLWKVCYLLQLTKKQNESTQSLVEKVDEFIERNSKYPDELEKLLSLNRLSDSELDAITYFRKAVKCGVIKFDRETKVYYRGGFNMKSGEMDSVKVLMLPENTAEYVAILQEVEKKEGVQGNTI